MTAMQPTMPPAGFPGQPGVPQSTRFTPIDPIRVLKQYMWWLIAALIVGIGLGVGLYFVLLQVSPYYTALAQVRVTPEMREIMGVGGGGTNERMLEMFKLTHAHMIGSDGMLRDAMDTPEVRRTQWYQQFGADNQERLLEMQDIVSIVPIRNTELIEVRVTISDAEESVTICNALATTYVSKINRATRDEGGQRVQLLRDRFTDLQADVDRLQNQSVQIATDNELAVLQYRFDEVGFQLQQTLQQYNELIAALEMTRFTYQTMVEAKQRGDFDFTPEDRQTVEMDPSIKNRLDRIVYLQEELRVAVERFGPNHRSVKDLERRVDATRVEMERERRRLLNNLQDYKISQMANQVAALEAQVASLNETLTELREQKRELNARLADYQMIQSELETKEEELQRIALLLEDMDLYTRDPMSDRVRVEALAQRPDEPSFPDPVVMVPGVTLLMLLLVGGVAFLKELLDQRIKSPSCVKMLPSAELCGVIPDAEEDPSGDASIELVVSRSPGSVLTEAFRQLRTEVVGRINSKGHKTLLIAGAQAGGGATSVAVNLAASMAINGRKVVLVDANFRVPGLHDAFGLPDQPGFGDVLRGSSELDRVIQQTPVEGLDMVPIGHGQQDVVESLESPTCQKTLAALGERYDVVIIDAPPVGVVSDSRVLAGYADACMMVVKAMVDKRGMVSRLVRQLRDTRAEFLGLVINGVRSSAGGYYRRSYREYYTYMQRGEDSRGSRSGRQARSDAADTLASGPRQ